MNTPLPASRRAAVLLLWLLLMAAAGWQITRTRFVADLSAFLPANPDAQQRVLIEQLQSGLPARTLLMAIEGGDAPARAAASRKLAAALRDTQLFEQVNNGDSSDWQAVGTWLFEHRYQLSPAVDAQRFTAAGLQDGIEETLSLLGTPAGNALKPLLDRDPTGETQRIAESLVPANAPRTEGGVWVARQGARALLVASTRAAGADLDAQANALARVRAAFAPIAAGAGTPGLTLKLSGAPVFSVDSRASIEGEVRWLATAGTVLMSALLLLAFASLPALLVAALPVATGVLAGITAVGLYFGSVHGITLGFGSTLIGEAVDYAIYFLIQARAGGWRAWVASGWPTVRLGLLTSVCGFAALVFSGFPGLAQLGVFSVAGLLGAALATRFVLPVLMPNGVGGAEGAEGTQSNEGAQGAQGAQRARGQGLRRQMGQFAAWAVRGLPRWRWPLLALGVVAVVVVLQRGDLWRGELSALSPVPKAALDLDASLRAELSAGDARALVVVQAADAETTLQLAETALARLAPLVERGALGGVDSVTRWLPSQATQNARQASLPDEAVLRAALAQATQGGPLKAERLAPFVADVATARTRPPITPLSLRGTALAPLVDALLLQRPDGSWAALMPLQPIQPIQPIQPLQPLQQLQPLMPLQPPQPLQPAGDMLDTAAVRAALKDLPGVQMLEVGAELSRLYARYLGEAQAQALFGALGVVLLMALSLRSWPRLLAVCQPLLLAVLLTLGGLAALGVTLGILHLVGLLLVVAVGSNYALFFDMLQRQAEAGAAPNHDTLASLLLANVTTVLSFGLIACSAIPALSAIGRVVAPGALWALVLAAAFAPRPRLQGR